LGRTTEKPKKRELSKTVARRWCRRQPRWTQEKASPAGESKGRGISTKHPGKEGQREEKTGKIRKNIRSGLHKIPNVPLEEG